MRFVVIVREDSTGPAWFLVVPALGVNTWVHDRAKIQDAAREIISRCGAAPQHFDVELRFGSPIPALLD